MDIKKIETYITSRNGTMSLLNLPNLNDYLTTDDYFFFQITDEYKYRLDKIAEDQIGDKSYYFFIMWLNDITSLDDLDSETIIKIPKLSFITKVKKDLEIIRGV
jgi:hypothetical protein